MRLYTIDAPFPTNNSSLVVTPTASAAVSAYEPNEAIDCLEATQGNLDQPHDQQHGEESQVPRHQVSRLTIIPQGVVTQVVPFTEDICPVAHAVIALWASINGDR